MMGKEKKLKESKRRRKDKKIADERGKKDEDESPTLKRKNIESKDGNNRRAELMR